MGLGKAMAGGGKSEDRQTGDFYPSPSDVTEALLRVHSFDRVWEPACGDGAMVRVLRKNGCYVVPSDLVIRSDYDGSVDKDGSLSETPMEMDFTYQSVRPQTVSAIITNPPFSLAQTFIETAMGLAVQRVAFVLKSSYWHAKSRHELFKRHTPSHIHPLLWRPDFMELGRPTMEVMWCVWTRGHAGLPVYQPLEKPI